MHVALRGKAGLCVVCSAPGSSVRSYWRMLSTPPLNNCGSASGRCLWPGMWNGRVSCSLCRCKASNKGVSAFAGADSAAQTLALVCCALLLFPGCHSFLLFKVCRAASVPEAVVQSIEGPEVQEEQITCTCRLPSLHGQLASACVPFLHLLRSWMNTSGVCGTLR